MADAIAITAYSSSILGGAICGLEIFKTEMFPKWLSGLFTAVAGIAFLLMATGTPADLEDSSFIIPVFMSFHLLLAVLGINVILRNK